MYFCVQTLIFVHYRINGISTGIKEFKNLNACGYKIKSSETVYGLNDFRCLFRCHAGLMGRESSSQARRSVTGSDKSAMAG